MTAIAKPVSTVQPGQVDPNMPIQFVLTVGQVNQVLKIIGTQPLAEVLELFTTIQGQGNMAVAAVQMAQVPSTPDGEGEIEGLDKGTVN